MIKKVIFSLLIRFFILVFVFVFLIFSFNYFSKAQAIKANIVVDTKKIVGFINPNWKALAQGGEEKGVRMLKNVILETSALYPRYIRIDHIFDFYDVFSYDKNNQPVFNFEKLDQTVCDIYAIGAKPFFSLGYMPPSLSQDGSLIDQPKNWSHWSLLVQKTIERYSGKDSRFCGSVSGQLLENIYYEVWNEPDLETFGKWSLYGGEKNYKTLYYYTVQGAIKAKNIYRFFLGGPATTALYKNWLTKFFDYVDKEKLRIDFVSWHHYSKNPDDFYQDLENFDRWLADEKYLRFRFLPKIISEWGYDSNPNPIADTKIGASHTITSIFNLVNQNLDLAFAFEIKDGINPSWGILTYMGEKKPRYFALKLLNVLQRNKLMLTGQGTYVKGLASAGYNKISLVLVNFDPNDRNNELVPVTFNNLTLGTYKITETNLEGKTISVNFTINSTVLKKNVIMTPNSALAIELDKLD
ncbi:MAG: glycosyl hydrolase [Patescibacteria group bacterium]|nr:glycosyl hydrolase [Patescibacteria group bacterium]